MKNVRYFIEKDKLIVFGEVKEFNGIEWYAVMEKLIADGIEVNYINILKEYNKHNKDIELKV